jgi:hypothetical protein
LGYNDFAKKIIQTKEIRAMAYSDTVLKQLIATALVTAVYTDLALRLIRTQSEPKVIMYVKHDFNRPSILMIVVENIGRDIAHDVKFFPSKPLPARAWGIESADAVEAETLTV